MGELSELGGREGFGLGRGCAGEFGTSGGTSRHGFGPKGALGGLDV